MLFCVIFSIYNKGSQSVTEARSVRPELPTSKFYCFGCGKVCDLVMRPEYEEFKVDNASRLCGDCFQKAYKIEVELWRQEQRREIGPDWEGFPTLKKVNFKKPISYLSTGGGGNRTVANSEKVLLDTAKGFVCILLSFLSSYLYFFAGVNKDQNLSSLSSSSSNGGGPQSSLEPTIKNQSNVENLSTPVEASKS